MGHFCCILRPRKTAACKRPRPRTVSHRQHDTRCCVRMIEGCASFFCHQRSLDRNGGCVSRCSALVIVSKSKSAGSSALQRSSSQQTVHFVNPKLLTTAPAVTTAKVQIQIRPAYTGRVDRVLQLAPTGFACILLAVKTAGNCWTAVWHRQE
jgi:hypothetical protein